MLEDFLFVVKNPSVQGLIISVKKMDSGRLSVSMIKLGAGNIAE